MSTVKVNINADAIRDFPVQDAKDAFYIVESKALEERLIAEINGTHPSSFLVSGYRGAGKTSFVNRIISQLESQYLVVHIPVPGYKEHTHLLRKIIRALYFAFKKTPLATSTTEDHQRLSRDLALVYERTFKDITKTENASSQAITTQVQEMSFDLKKLLSLLAVGLSVFTLLQQYHFLLPKAVQWLSLAASSIWAIWSWTVKSTDKRESQRTTAQSAKTLYDDEIAEHVLNELIADLKHNGQKPVFVFDELDKISDPKKLEELLGHLKTFLLSGQGHCIVVAGQELYYQWDMARRQDDPLMASVFSRVVHIPFLNYNSLKKLCHQLIVDEPDRNNKLVNLFFDHLILESGRIPRRLLSGIKNHLSWENKKAVLIINDLEQQQWETHSAVLSVLNQIIENDLPALCDSQVMVDFYSRQLGLWVEHILNNPGLEISVQKLSSYMPYDATKYPETYLQKLRGAADLLISKLQNAGYARAYMDPEDHHEFWQFSYKRINETDELQVARPEPSGPTDDPVEQLTRIVFAMHNVIIRPNKRGEPAEVATALNELQTSIDLSLSSFLRESLSKILGKESAKYRRPSLLPEDEKFLIRRVVSELFHAYVFWCVSEVFLRFAIRRDTTQGFDIIAQNSSATVLFEIKALQFEAVTDRDVQRMIGQYTGFAETDENNTFFVGLIFHPPSMSGISAAGRRMMEQAIVEAKYLGKFQLTLLDNTLVAGTHEELMKVLQSVYDKAISGDVGIR